MSAVRMCDNCGGIFSEREDFTTGIGTRVTRDKDTGERRAITTQLDYCGDCTVKMEEGAQRPQIRPALRGAAPAQLED